MKATISETEFKDQIIQFAKLHKWRVAHFRPAQTAKGWRTAVRAARLSRLDPLRVPAASQSGEG